MGTNYDDKVSRLFKSTLNALMLIIGRLEQTVVVIPILKKKKPMTLKPSLNPTNSIMDTSFS